MTVATQTFKVTASGNDVATVFSFSPMVIYGADDLLVTVATAAGVETVISRGSSSTTYSMGVSVFPNTGSITYPAVGGSPLITGSTITMKRVLTLEQLTNLENQGGYLPEVQETQLDKIVMMILQQQELINRCLKLQVSYSGAITPNISDVPAIGEFVRVNGTGTGFEFAAGAGAGPAGPTGATGATGPAGADGAGWVAGLQTIWVPAGAMVARSTNGAAGVSVELATNKNMLRTLDFDATTQEFAQFDIAMPKSWNEGTVTAQPIWTAASGSGAVVWAVQAVATSDDDAMDAAFGTEQTSTDTLLAANDCHIAPTTAAITIAGTPVVNDRVQFQVKRNPADVGDTLAVDAKLLGVRVFYTADAVNDT